MIHFTEKLYEEYCKELEAVKADGDEIKIATLRLQVTKSYLEQLRAFISTYAFKSPKEEIIFFKKIKHRFYSPMIYYTELLFVHTNLPSGDKKMRKSYYKSRIENNNVFIERNRVLLSYYKMGHTQDDELMFLRESDCYPLHLEYAGDIDSSFSTICSSLLSKLLAFEETNTYLSGLIEQLEVNDGDSNQPAEEKTEGEQCIRFMGKKSELHELLIAMHENGNFGDVPLNRVMVSFGTLLGIDPGNYYSSLTDLAMRKKSRTPYLESLIKALDRRLNRKLDEL